MFKKINTEQLFFSTKVELLINGVRYRPSICYKVPTLAKASLEKFVLAGKVIFYKEPIRFVNGIATKKAPGKTAVAVPSVVRTTEPVKRKKK